jgi:DNA-directed RNA polymerase specialized sigma24 family protein
LGGVTTPPVSPLHRLRDARPGLVRLARRHSLCASDADDAVQRAFEILLRRSERVHPATALTWLRTVMWRTIRTWLDLTAMCVFRRFADAAARAS